MDTLQGAHMHVKALIWSLVQNVSTTREKMRRAVFAAARLPRHVTGLNTLEASVAQECRTRQQRFHISVHSCLVHKEFTLFNNACEATPVNYKIRTTEAHIAAVACITISHQSNDKNQQGMRKD